MSFIVHLLSCPRTFARPCKYIIILVRIMAMKINENPPKFFSSSKTRQGLLSLSICDLESAPTTRLDEAFA